MGAYQITKRSIASLAIALGNLPDDDSYDPILFHNKKAVNWERLLYKLDVPQAGMDVRALNQICENINLPWTYHPKTPVSWANVHFKAWFRSITSISFGAVEGGHRCFIINRMMMGMRLKTKAPYDIRNANKQTYPKNSSLDKKIQLVMFNPACEYTNDLLNKIRHCSQTFQTLKTKRFHTSYRVYLKEVLTNRIDNMRRDISDEWNTFEKYLKCDSRVLAKKVSEFLLSFYPEYTQLFLNSELGQAEYDGVMNRKLQNIQKKETLIANMTDSKKIKNMCVLNNLVNNMVSLS